MGGPQEHAKQKKPDTKGHTLYNCTWYKYTKCPKKANIKRQSRLVWGWEREWGMTVIRYKFSSAYSSNVLELCYSDGC